MNIGTAKRSSLFFINFSTRWLRFSRITTVTTIQFRCQCYKTFFSSEASSAKSNIWR